MNSTLSQLRGGVGFTENKLVMARSKCQKRTEKINKISFKKEAKSRSQRVRKNARLGRGAKGGDEGELYFWIREGGR